MPEATSKSPPPETLIRSILILRWGGVGDFLLTLPAISAVRKHFPNARLAVMGSADTIELAATTEYADEVLEFDWAISSHQLKDREAARQRMMQKLQEFEFIINYHSFGPVDQLLAGSGASFMSFDDQAFIRERKHASEHFLDFVRALAPAPISSRPQVYLSEDEKRFSQKFLHDRGADLRKACLVAVHVSSGDPQKRWFPDRYRQVIRWLAGRGAQVLLLVGPADDDTVRLVYEGGELDEVIVVHDLPIRKVAAILQRATLFLGNDSGLMHLAAAVGTPIVAVFGPSDPVVWGPLGPRHVIILGNCLRIDGDAEGCRSCAFPECLDSIKTEGVIQVVRERLKHCRRFLSTSCWGRYFSSRQG